MKGTWKTVKPKYRRKEFNTVGRWECTCSRCISNRLHSDAVRLIETELEMHEFVDTPLSTKMFAGVPKKLTDRRM